jgi:hypothetical protein
MRYSPRRGISVREFGERGGSLVAGVERQRRLVRAVAVFGGVLGVLFHQVRGIGQQQRAEFARGGVGEDRSGEAAANQVRQVSGVIEMGVREQSPADGGGIHRQRFPIALAQLVAALEEAAIHQEAFAIGFDEIFGAGDGAGGTQERELRHRGVIVDGEGRGSNRRQGVSVRR